MSSYLQELASTVRESIAENKPTQIGLADYCQRTFHFTMHSWQSEHLCTILEKAFWNPGSRIFIHAPPQHGKSCIVSVRFPSWALGMNPLLRIGVACFNEEHAESFSSSVIKLMQAPLHEQLFPDDGARLERTAPPKKAWQTAARANFAESQASFAALGMDTGTAGKGFDILIIDDPYGTIQEARSPAINKKIREWWAENIEPRISSQTTIIFMFHRYHDADIMAHILKQSAEEWDIYRFSAEAIAADDPILKPIDGIDPTNRQPGEPLSPIRTKEFYDKKKRREPELWWGQFQGKPLSHRMKKLRPEDLRVISAAKAPIITTWAEGWDTAVSKKHSNNRSAGALVGFHKGDFYIKRVVKGHWKWPETEERILHYATTNPPGTATGIEVASQSLGFYQQLAQNRIFANRELLPISPLNNTKLERATGWIKKANQGRLFLIDDGSGWIPDFIEEALDFTGEELSPDDQIDAVTVAVETLATMENIYDDEDSFSDPPPIASAEWLADYYAEYGGGPSSDPVNRRRDALFERD